MIKFTRHALLMLAQRKIGQNKVKLCLKAPDIIKPGASNRKIYFKEFAKNYLKVVVAKQDKDLTIITVHWIDKKRVKK